MLLYKQALLTYKLISLLCLNRVYFRLASLANDNVITPVLCKFNILYHSKYWFSFHMVRINLNPVNKIRFFGYKRDYCGS